MAEGKLTHFLSLPELNIYKVHHWKKGSHFELVGRKNRSSCEVCPKCAQPSKTIYDHRWVYLRDEPLRGSAVTLRIKKARYLCRTCKKVFTEPLPGVLPKRRTTQRYKNSLMWACENFSDLKRVRKAFRCSSGFIYKTLYQQLELKIRRDVNYPWPEKIGIDEHFFSRSQHKKFATLIVDMNNKRPRTLVLGKDRNSLSEALQSIPGRENVRWVAMDLSDTYKGFIFQYFPKAQIVADKFHVLRLLSPHLIKRRKTIAPSRMTAKAKRLLTCSAKKLDYEDRKAIAHFLKQYPELQELYEWKERLHGFYRIKGYYRARTALESMTIEMLLSNLPEVRKLAKTLRRWKNEVLNYFVTRLTNARTEGFNNVAKLVQKRGYGYKNFDNYKLRYLNACR